MKRKLPVSTAQLKKLLLRYEFLFAFGLLIAILSICNVLGYTSINSDLFWTFAGLEIALVSAIELYYVWIDTPAQTVENREESPIFDEAEKRYDDWRNPHENQWGDDH